MALRVEGALQRASQVLERGDLELAADVVGDDDAIDQMLVSLTERCYEILCRQAPVASDLRLIVSVLRIVSDLERAGDLCLRIVKLAPDQPLLARSADTFQLLQTMGIEALRLFRIAVEAWARQDLALAKSLEERDDAMDQDLARLTAAVLALEGPDAVPLAIQTLAAGRAFERIADHAVMIGERVRYLLTGDVTSLSKEIGP